MKRAAPLRAWISWCLTVACLAPTGLVGCHASPSKLGGDESAPCARYHQALLTKPRDPERPDVMSYAEREAFEQEWIRTHEYISRGDAVELAERWVADQGFTDAPPKPGVVVSHDIVDFGTDEEILANRHGRLRPRAVGTMKRAARWVVAFAYAGSKTERDPTRGSGVLVSHDGKRIRMQHQSVCLPLFDEE